MSQSSASTRQRAQGPSSTRNASSSVLRGSTRFQIGERVRRIGRIAPCVHTRTGTVIATALQDSRGEVRVLWDCPQTMKRRRYRNSVPLERLESLGTFAEFDRRLAERP